MFILDGVFYMWYLLCREGRVGFFYVFSFFLFVFVNVICRVDINSLFVFDLKLILFFVVLDFGVMEVVGICNFKFE